MRESLFVLPAESWVVCGVVETCPASKARMRTRKCPAERCTNDRGECVCDSGPVVQKPNQLLCQPKPSVTVLGASENAS